MWRAVRGYEGLYEVSDDGQVRHLARTTIRSDGRVVRYGTKSIGNRLNKFGYYRAALKKDGRVRDIFVHRLVAEAFLFDSYFDGAEVLHWDDVKTNNSVDNLRWGTRSENMRDKVRNGRHHQTRKTHCPQKHEYTPENTYLHQGQRKCRECKTARGRVYGLTRVRDRRKRVA